MVNKRTPTKTWIARECLNCKKEFKLPADQVAKGWGKYCSNSCNSSKNGFQKGVKKFGENNAHWKGGLTKNRYRYKLIHKSRYPEKVRAREIVAKAKKSGKLIPEPCFICGNEKVHAHHEDYSKPLDVQWMCVKCHHAEHN